jgi:hypothetical protein
MSWWDNLLEIWISSFFTARLSAALKWELFVEQKRIEITPSSHTMHIFSNIMQQ